MAVRHGSDQAQDRLEGPPDQGRVPYGEAHAERHRPPAVDGPLIAGPTPVANDLNEPGALVENACGAGGTVKDGRTELQGDHLRAAEEALQEIGYKTRAGRGWYRGGRTGASPRFDRARSSSPIVPDHGVLRVLDRFPRAGMPPRIDPNWLRAITPKRATPRLIMAGGERQLGPSSPASARLYSHCSAAQEVALEARDSRPPGSFAAATASHGLCRLHDLEWPSIDRVSSARIIAAPPRPSRRLRRPA